MTRPKDRYVLWVKRDDAPVIADAVLRERVGIEDSGVEVRVEALGTWGVAKIPPVSRDEAGGVFHQVLNVGRNQLPPAGRVFEVKT